MYTFQHNKVRKQYSISGENRRTMRVFSPLNNQRKYLKSYLQFRNESKFLHFFPAFSYEVVLEKL